mmetsp:Transcript_13121/g.20774  ORF Transcript_13121/g.20774 Transcript_13121/m.20774 type:complete len:504 (-) Transcript_13121:229-1740(-)
MCLQVLQAVLVCTGNQQRLAREKRPRADEEVGELEVLPAVRVVDPPLRRELARHVAAVANWDLGNHDLVVHGIVRDHQPPHLVLRLAVDELGFEAEDLARFRHHLRQVDLRSLWNNHLCGYQRVLRLSNAVVWRRCQLPVLDGLVRHVDLSLELIDAKVVLEEIPGEVVAVVEHHRSTPYFDRAANNEVFWQVEWGICGQHPRHGHAAVLLVQGPPLHETRVFVSTGVAAVRLIDLNGVVREVVVDNKVDPGAVEGVVVPETLEPENLPVVEQELYELLVSRRCAQLEFHEGFGVHRTLRWRNAPLLYGLCQLVALLPQVHHQRLVFAHIDAVLLVEPACEAVAARHVIRPAVERELRPAAEVVWADETLTVITRHAVTPQEGALLDARVLHPRLRNAHGTILHEVHNGDLPVAAVLVGTLYDGLLEEAVEAEDLLLVLQPGWTNRRMAHVGRYQVFIGGWGRGVQLGVAQAPAGLLHQLRQSQCLLCGWEPSMKVHSRPQHT